MKIFRYHLLLFLSMLTLLLTCNQDDENVSMGKPCEPQHYDKLIDTWSDAIYDSDASCLDTLCIACELVLREDSTYQLSYSLFNTNLDTLIVYELEDTGTYSFDCLDRVATKCNLLMSTSMES